MNPSFALLQSIGGALLALVVVVVVGWFAIAKIRGWMRDNLDASEPFTLEDLRRLHRDGQLTDEEYERAKGMMIGTVRNAPSSKELAALRERASKAAPAGRAPADPGPQRPRPSAQIRSDGQIRITDGDAAASDAPPTPPRPSAPGPTDPRTDGPA